MLLDLFSSLDYKMKKTFFKKILWLISFLWLIYYFNFFFLKKYFFLIISKMMFLCLKKMKMKILKNMKLSKLIFLVCFFFIFNTKMWGLLPYIFGKSTQLVYAFTISFLIWFSIFMSNIMFKMKSFSGHLTPEGAPMLLIYLLNKMEFLSKLIRPLTLCLRLSINMSTGHIFFVLLCKGLMSFIFSKKIFYMIFFFFLIFYLFFELGICLLQGFVFSLLCVQYLDEHSKKFLSI